MKTTKPINGTEKLENAEEITHPIDGTEYLRQQFKLITSDGKHEIIAYERQALKAYYRAKLELDEALDMDEDDGGVTSGYVELRIRNINTITLKATEWEIYQEYVVPEPTDEDDDTDNDDDDDEALDSINEDSVTDDDDDDDE